MHILIVDIDNFQTKTRRALIEDAGHTTVLATTLGELHLAFKPGVFGLVIIDHSINAGQDCFNHIIAEAPEQNILTVSSAVTCILPHCDVCARKYTIRRLNNPTSFPNIMRMIQGLELYDCDHYDCETEQLSS